MKHLHWEILAYDKKDDKGAILEGTSITLVDFATEAEALKQAKDMVKRESYWIRTVYECKTCGFMEKQIKQLEDLAKRGGMPKKPWEKDDV